MSDSKSEAHLSPNRKADTARWPPTAPVDAEDSGRHCWRQPSRSAREAPVRTGAHPRVRQSPSDPACTCAGSEQLPRSAPLAARQPGPGDSTSGAEARRPPSHHPEDPPRRRRWAGPGARRWCCSLPSNGPTRLCAAGAAASGGHTPPRLHQWR